ncbi:MAG: GNAT family N-acetyltransferase [Deltaproteobacteria bacterium]|nr:GNAT family N-acetyltransferase [Deltaproteobacteria bacterium]
MPDRAGITISILRHLSTSDLEEIGEISEDAFIRFGHYRDFISSLAADEEGVITSGMKDNGKLVGFILTGFLPANIDNKDGIIADILAIALIPDYRYMGLGKELMEWALDLVDSIRDYKDIFYVRLTVAPDNVPAVSLFERFGFEFDISTIGSYPTGVDAVYMKKYFDSGE